MRTLLTILLGTIITASAVSGFTEHAALTAATSFSSALSGATNSGVDFANVPPSATYGMIGAGFLLLTVLRRRHKIYK